MEDTVLNNTAIEIAQFIDDHKGLDTKVIDIKDQNSWTNVFIITTVNSHTHLQGIFKYLRKFLSQKGISILHRQKKITDQGWFLIDCGFIVIHLMNKDKREFYDLEKLWFSGKLLYQSSKSS